ncbi:hypothetical protein HYH03_008912 [Edaphochlamys debaryana]|uniref:Chromate transporter n=1 Tax=Edaphochlamys debaryana TaxID=47281 RepID=A0A836BXH3_9CHLO|nr:hypothetical protein HYH03_008912 [Edaphochlamys debaryana]|eukprot:KAG2492746.1 hypothetical protein HYH03_008912 [Edaphochlamys debaryana]
MLRRGHAVWPSGGPVAEGDEQDERRAPGHSKSDDLEAATDTVRADANLNAPTATPAGLEAAPLPQPASARFEHVNSAQRDQGRVPSQTNSDDLAGARDATGNVTADVGLVSSSRPGSARDGDVPPGGDQGRSSSSRRRADKEGGGGEGGDGGDEEPPEGAKKVEDEEPEVYAKVSYLDILKSFSLMGYIGFGGPAAHIGLFQRYFVERYKWMSIQVFTELFSLGQCLPGPTSTQVSFAIGTVKKGVLGGLLSGALFQYPGAFVMTLVGAGAANFLTNPPGWLDGIVAGLSAVGVALVASAAKGLLLKLCNTHVTAIVGTLAAAAAIYWVLPWLYPLLIVLGFIVTNITDRKLDKRLTGEDGGVESLGFGLLGGGILVIVWLAVLAAVLVLARTVYEDGNGPLNWFEAFYRTGSIIYGGGQVVLPMLLTDVVKTYPNGTEREDTWVTERQFYAGLGAVQAMPGPLFNFSAYLGCIMAIKFDYPFILGAVLAWFGLFSPGVMLMFGVLPYWKKFRTWQVYRRGLSGMNAVGVGLILASVFTMTLDVYKISPFPTASLCIGLFAFTAVDELKIFEPFVVLGGAVLGVIAWAADLD